MTEIEVLKKAAQIALARKSFWEFCKMLEPSFYLEHRTHLKILCNTLNNFYFGLPLDSTGKIYKGLMINMLPQHGKTRTMVNWCKWIFGENRKERIIVGCYNEVTSGEFGRYTRDGIIEKKNIPEQIVYADIFPKTKLKYGDSSYYKWALEGQHFNFLATSPGGTSTGKGGTIKITDDLVKGFAEAVNANHLEKIYQWYLGTFASRDDAEAKGEPLEVMMGTRWAKKDPFGRVLEDNPDKWFQLTFKAQDENGNMLCEDFLSKEAYEQKRRVAYKYPATKAIHEANYNQVPIDILGSLYRNLKTYRAIPIDYSGSNLFQGIYSYTDSADEGDDYLCQIIYGVYDSMRYILDVYYTLDSADITEDECVKRLTKFDCNVSYYESNAGGRSFARNIKRKLEQIGRNDIVIKWFHQSKNKIGRIVSNSAAVQEFVLFPVNWSDRWPEFYEHVTGFNKEGKAAQPDDCVDALTGVIEKSVNMKLSGA